MLIIVTTIHLKIKKTVYKNRRCLLTIHLEMSVYYPLPNFYAMPIFWYIFFPLVFQAIDRISMSVFILALIMFLALCCVFFSSLASNSVQKILSIVLKHENPFLCHFHYMSCSYSHSAGILYCQNNLNHTEFVINW